MNLIVNVKIIFIAISGKLHVRVVLARDIPESLGFLLVAWQKLGLSGLLAMEPVKEKEKKDSLLELLEVTKPYEEATTTM